MAAKPIVIFPGKTERPCTRCYGEDFTCAGEAYPAGVYHHGVSKSNVLIDEGICSPIRGLAITHTEAGFEYSLLVEYKAARKEGWYKMLIPKSALVTNRAAKVARRLASAGVEFKRSRWTKVHWYLERLNPETVLIVGKSKGDWRENAILLPSQLSWSMH